jgi:hypothetical protein
MTVGTGSKTISKMSVKCAAPWVTERTQCASSCFASGNGTHRMRVRLTVRYSTLVRAAASSAIYGQESHS